MYGSKPNVDLTRSTWVAIRTMAFTMAEDLTKAFSGKNKLSELEQAYVNGIHDFGVSTNKNPKPQDFRGPYWTKG